MHTKIEFVINDKGYKEIQKSDKTEENAFWDYCAKVAKEYIIEELI